MRQDNYFLNYFHFLKNTLYGVQASGLQLIVNIFRKPSTWTYNKDNL